MTKTKCKVMFFYLRNCLAHLSVEKVVSGWEADENLSLVIYRHPLARLASAYFNKIKTPNGKIFQVNFVICSFGFYFRVFSEYLLFLNI